MITRTLYFEQNFLNTWQKAKANKVEYINLSKNQFTAIDFPTFEMPDVQILELSYNKTEIEKLVIDAAIFPNVEYIFAYQSKIKSFEIKGNLSKLKEINLGENKIEKLELSIIDRCPNLEYLVLSENPFVDNLPEGTIENDNTLANVKEFLNALKDGTQQNDEIRIILVGNSTSGKTTFYRLMIDVENFDKSKLYSTHEMGTYRVEVDREETSSSAQPKKIYINLWDFGGQEFYHVIHQLFLGKNTIYLLFMTEKYNQNAILSTSIRKKQKDGSIQDTEEKIEHFHHTYWLQTIRDNENIDIEKGEKYSPILLVQNKIDMYPTSIDFNDKCVEEYQINRNDNVFRLSLDKVIESTKNEQENDYTRNFEKFGEKFTELRDKTLDENEIPTIWTLVRNIIRKLSEQKNYLTYQEFYEECSAIYPQDKKPTTINALIGWLKAIGTILYYGNENENLKDIVFINPIWVSNIIYEILNYDVKNNKGKFNKKHALGTLKGNESLTDIFLNLMKYEKFGLIFQIPNTDEYIAPQYLDADCNNQSSLKLFTNLTKFSFSLYYPDILPNSILTKFISKYGEYVKEYDELCWKNGIVFYHKTKCIFVQKVKKNDKQYIEVKIQDNEQEIAQEIFNTFLEIHKSKKNISISVVENDKDSFVDINKLKNKIENKKPEIESITEKELKVSDFGFLFNQKFNPTKKQVEDMLQHEEHKIKEKLEYKELKTTSNMNTSSIPESFITELKKQIADEYVIIADANFRRNIIRDISEKQKYEDYISACEGNIAFSEKKFLQRVQNQNQNISENEVKKLILELKEEIKKGFENQNLKMEELFAYLEESHKPLLIEILQQRSGDELKLMKQMYDKLSEIKASEANIFIDEISENLPANLPQREAIQTQLNSMEVTANGKLKLAIPLIPSILSYEIEIGKQWTEKIPKVWQAIVALFKRKA